MVVNILLLIRSKIGIFYPEGQYVTLNFWKQHPCRLRIKTSTDTGNDVILNTVPTVYK